MERESETVDLQEASSMLSYSSKQSVLNLIATGLLVRTGTRRRPIRFKRSDVETLARIFAANRQAARKLRGTRMQESA